MLDIWEKIEKFCGQKVMADVDGKHYEVSHRDMAILSGIVSFGLVFTGMLTIMENPIFSIVKVLYGFLICIPIAYYQMNNAEKEAVMKVKE